MVSVVTVMVVAVTHPVHRFGGFRRVGDRGHGRGRGGGVGESRTGDHGGQRKSRGGEYNRLHDVFPYEAESGPANEIILPSVRGQAGRSG